MNYNIAKTAGPPSRESAWGGVPWDAAETLNIGCFHDRSSEHRPGVEARALYDDTHLYVMFRVRDRYVRCVHDAYQDPVCRDSCVEFFVQPGQDKGYFNFEFNCGGAMLLYYIEDARRGPEGFRKFRPVREAHAEGVRVRSSLPPRVEPEIADEITWTLAADIPFDLFHAYAGPVTARPGDAWRANFYKCGDETSHPHWASWMPIGRELNFHVPECFGTIRFA